MLGERCSLCWRVSVLFNEPKLLKCIAADLSEDPALRFSALQRAEIAEIEGEEVFAVTFDDVSVLFNEPKLLKYIRSFPALDVDSEFQCSSTSRNC